LPAAPAGGLAVPAAPSAAATPSCGPATLAAPAGGNAILFTGGSVAPGQTCIVTIPVQTSAGNPLGSPENRIYISSPVTLTSTQAAPVTAGPAIWSVSRP
jgi:hypothetical protein